MKTKPIAVRVFQIVLFGNLAMLMMILAFAWWSLEMLEATAIEADRQIELDYFLHYGEKDKPHRIQSSQLISVFQPVHTDNPQPLPIVFQNIPVPFQGEVEVLEKEYSVIAHNFPEGTFYLAKDLRLFEEQEEMLISSVLILALTILLASLVLAYIASKKISRPISRFTASVSRIKSNHSVSLIDEQFTDDELNQMVHVVNALIQQINQSMERERRFIAMASHELRTPIAIVLGAANILEKRKRLDVEDQLTLQRIVRAAHEMSENTQSLLALVRASKASEPAAAIDLATLIQQLCDDFAIENALYGSRLRFQPDTRLPPLHCNQVLVRILLQNLLRNSLQHTRGPVEIRQFPQHLEILDEGAATNSLADVLPGSLPDPGEPGSGLGLYIVALACDALGWSLSLSRREQANGNCIRLDHPAA